jgi:hypothetical protein
MAETSSNIEFAHRIHEQGHHHGPPSDPRGQWVEMLEAIVLAVVAVATAWSGYQAAKWDALSAEHYNRASRLNVEAQALAGFAGQERLYDIITANGWIMAKSEGNDKLAAGYERRFRPEYAVAAAAWLKLDPEHNPSAPPGPIFMPEYVSEKAQRSQALAAEAKEHFEQGVSTRETGDQYVKITVLLATVLLLSALSQRFHVFGPRVAVLGVATILLAVSLYAIATFPRVMH